MLQALNIEAGRNGTAEKHNEENNFETIATYHFCYSRKKHPVCRVFEKDNNAPTPRLRANLVMPGKTGHYQ
ncbi:hypothetical protein J2X14_000914 [Pantoea alhagi]|nr:hypothetical protein [Pantoea alhagi]